MAMSGSTGSAAFDAMARSSPHPTSSPHAQRTSLARTRGRPPILARRKAAFAVAVLTMTLALGANTVVFSALKTFLFSSIGVPDADRLLAITPTRDLGGTGSVEYDEAYPNYEISHGAGGYRVARKSGRVSARPASPSDIDRFLGFFGLRDDRPARRHRS